MGANHTWGNWGFCRGGKVDGTFPHSGGLQPKSCNPAHFSSWDVGVKIA